MQFSEGHIIGYLPIKVAYINYEDRTYSIDFGSTVVEGIYIDEFEALRLEEEVNKEAAKLRIKKKIEQLQSTLKRLEEDE